MATYFACQLGGWTARPPQTTPALTRYFSQPPSSTAAAAAAVGTSEPDALPEGGDEAAAAQSAEPAKRPRRPQRGSKTKAEPSTEAEPDAAAFVVHGAQGPASPEGGTTKKRVPPRRKPAAAAGSEPVAVAQSSAESGGPVGKAGAHPAKQTWQKREAQPALAVETAGGGTGVAGSTSAETSSSGGSGTGSSGKKRSSRGVAKKAEEEREERPGIRDLLYEDFLVLPRKAEQVLIALGALQRPPPPGAAGSAGAAAFPGDGNPVGSSASPQPQPQPVPPHSAARPGQLSNVLQLSAFLGWGRPTDTVVPLLVSQYQGYLGADCDFLFDLFAMDFGPPNLPSEVLKAAAVDAARSLQGRAVTISSLGGEVVARRAMEVLKERVGEEAVAEQERRFQGLTEAQLYFFLMDLASSLLTGEGHVDDPQYLARRCAALQLTRPIVLQRLHRYTSHSASLQDLASASGKTVRLSQAMEALVEGLKAGVRLDRHRLLADFRLGSPADPLHEHIAALEKAVAEEAARAADPGGLLFYPNLREKLRLRSGLQQAIHEQEEWWKREQGERDGSTLTNFQLRLLFHLGRLERFRREGRRFGPPGG